jgi:MFS family permease
MSTPPPATLDNGTDAKEEKPASSMFRALRHRNYRLFFIGQVISLTGSFLTLTATNWLVLRMTHSAKMLGLVAFSGQIGMFALAPFAGVWVDRVNRQRLLVITQTLAMFESFALAILALSGHITVGEILALNFFQSIINAFDMPGRQAFLIEMINGREDLANAIALNSIMVHGARLMGPAIAGLLIAWVGEGLCFTLDGISYIGVIIAFWIMVVTPRQMKVPRSVMVELKEGFRYIWDFLPIRILLIVMAVVSLTAIPALNVLMPIYAAYFAGAGGAGARLYGILGTATGLGALIGSFYLASRKTVVGLGRLIAIAAAVFGVALACFALSRYLWLSLLIVPLGGWAMITLFASCNTIVQTLSDDDKRGRVMSFFTLAFAGVAPFGNLLAGYMAGRFLPPGANPVVGASRALMVEAAICFIAAAAFVRALPTVRKYARPVYVQKGILPETGVNVPPTMATAEQ